MRRVLQIVVVLIGIVSWRSVGHTQTGSSSAGRTPTWDRLQFLLGTWDSKEDTQPGSGEGTASFTRELNGQIIVRRSFAKYPQTGSRHDDLLIVYRDAPDAPPRAIYFDSEGHVIRYSIATPTEHAAVF